MKQRNEELITQSEAAEIRGMSLAAVNEHVRSGRWRSEFRFGKRLVYRVDVESFEPKTHKAKHRLSKQNRKPKANSEQTARKPKANGKHIKGT